MGKKSKQMSIAEYMKQELNEGLVYSAITKRIRAGQSLPNVKKYVPFNRTYILYVNQE